MEGDLRFQLECEVVAHRLAAAESHADDNVPWDDEDEQLFRETEDWIDPNPEEAEEESDMERARR